MLIIKLDSVFEEMYFVAIFLSDCTYGTSEVKTHTLQDVLVEVRMSGLNPKAFSVVVLLLVGKAE